MMQNVLGSKVFQEAKCSRDQNVLRSKMFLEAKYESAMCAKQKSVLGSKVCVSQTKSKLLNANLLPQLVVLSLITNF